MNMTSRHLRYILNILLLFIASNISAQSFESNNYVTSQTMLDSIGTNAFTSTEFYDGLGRPVEKTETQADNSFLTTAIRYDALGREATAILPVNIGPALDYIGSGKAQSSAATRYGDSWPYASHSYDFLGRETECHIAGRDWQDIGHSVRMEYGTNGSNEVKHYLVLSYGDTQLKDNGWYPASWLSYVRTTDEDGAVSVVYKDKAGRKILERRMDGATAYDTYFVYNTRGQLRFVLPPACQKGGDISDYSYEYRYDGHGNISEKILPGGILTKYWYDSLDRPVFSQDAVQKERGLYGFTFYDVFGRVCLNGICRSMGSFHEDVDTMTVRFVKGSEGFWRTGYYSGRVLESISSPIVEQVNYYDDYDFMANKGLANCDSLAVLLNDSHGSAIGQQTGSMERCSNGKYIASVSVYDGRGRITATGTTTLGGGSIITKSMLSFTGNPVETHTTYSGLSAKCPDVKAVYNNAYSTGNDALLQTDLSLNIKGTDAGTHRITDVSYDDLGRVISRTRPGKAGEEKYGYDLHGWTTSVSTGDFSEQLSYANPATGTPRYNGDISLITWTRDSMQPRGYKLLYDGLGRMTRAEYGEGSGLGDNAGRYDERITNYDANGNIMGLVRNGRRQDGSYGSIDDLTITRNGNRLLKVTDHAPRLVSKGSFDFNDDDNSTDEEYTFDANGAMTADRNKGIALIEYDDNNWPRRILFTNGSVTEYVYTASGTKLRTVHYKAMPNISVPMGERHELTRKETVSKDSTDYLGSLILINGRAKRYLYSGGYCQMNYIDDLVEVEPLRSDSDRQFAQATIAKAATRGTISPSIDPGKGIDRNKIISTAFLYYNRDHLGNIREVVDEEGKICQSLDYYPFGTPYSDGTAKKVNMQPYKYNGKELDRTHGLDTYDYGARQYDPVLAQWTSVDPMAEKYFPYSPYEYCLNDPIKHVDIDGNSTWVSFMGNDQYRVVGGDLYDGDCNVYVYTLDKRGEPYQRIRSIGKSLTITSFYNSDYDHGKGAWAKGSIINMNDNSGNKFIKQATDTRVSLPKYIYNARNKHKYDFKSTNGNDYVKYGPGNYYRGMPVILGNKVLIASARDIGNYVAGYKVGMSGLSWHAAVKAFDMYESRSLNITKREGISTRNAEAVGYMWGRYNTLGHGRDAGLNLGMLIISIFGSTDNLNR